MTLRPRSTGDAAAGSAPTSNTSDDATPNDAVSPEAGLDSAPVTQNQPATPTGADLMTLLATLVSERTGYPLDMLGADLDLEADLSIDSIKRLEILGELTERAGLGGTTGPGESLDESIVEELVAQKSLRAIVAWVDAHLSADTTSPSTSADTTSPSTTADTTPRTADATPTAQNSGAKVADARTADATPTAADASASDAHDRKPEPAGPLPLDTQSAVPESAVRAVFRVVSAPPSVEQRDAPALAGHSITVVDDGRGVAPLVASLLESHGASAHVVEPGAIPGQCDGIVHMGLLHPGAETAADLFEQVHRVAVAGTSTLIAVTGLGGTHGRFMDETGSPRHPAPWGRSKRREGANGAHRADADGVEQTGAGVAGLWRALARELPDAHVRAVDLDRFDDPVVLAGHIVSEVLAPGGPVAVGYRDGTRCTVIATEKTLDAKGVIRREPPGTNLGPKSVVLLTGGARGITARLALSLATTYGCSLELVGRSPLPDAPEDPDVAAAADATDLRRVLIARGMREPAAIEASCAQLLAAREIRFTLSQLDNAGAKVSYHAVDVRDAEALRGVVASVYDRHGRLDGIVHGAGVIEDRLLADKTPESFRRVFDTKVSAAHTLVAAVRKPHPFIVLFTSVSGAFGNKGQVDYAAANDALATLAWSLTSRHFGPVVAVDWGPWAGTGMVSAPLDREYARRGIGLVHPEDGVARLLDELRTALPEPEIVLARARVSTFEAPFLSAEVPQSESTASAAEPQSSESAGEPQSAEAGQSEPARDPQSVSAGEP